MDFLTKVGKVLGISNTEGAMIGAQLAQGNFGGAIGTTLTSLGGEAGTPASTPSDVSGPPAGVDSPATVSNVSQTGQFQSGFGNFDPGIMSPMVNQGFIGGLANPLVGGAISAGKNLFSKPGVTGLVGGGLVGGVVDFFLDEFGQQRKLVITRKLQRDIKKIFMMTGGDPRTTSDIYRSATGRFIPEDKILKILLKTFKNQGPFVTKAAVRKTRSTIRKMETLCDLKDRLCPPKRAAARRRMPAKSTTITNVR